MLIRRASLAYRLLALVPLSLSPYLLLPARVGHDCDTFAQVCFRHFGDMVAQVWLRLALFACICLLGWLSATAGGG